jgi:DNA-binding transcriptional regulator YdaS (Cro superfamily)
MNYNETKQLFIVSAQFKAIKLIAIINRNLSQTSPQKERKTAAR